ncbi:MAG: diguanylate cyclase [Rhodocyclaceae bacterium]|nr:MAG: diguanylate cyclase [Rhodocyclaceae bacterium]
MLVQGFAFLLVAKLVSDLRASKVLESELAREDRLTGLLNSRAFHEQTPHVLALCQRDASPIVMAYIDLDDFKLVNDTQGHRRGDAVLQIAAHTMQSVLRTSDLLSRLGGDEFAVLLPNTSVGAATETFERLRRAIEDGMRTAGCKVTASIGAVACSHAPTDVDELIDAADRVMYGVKRSGKNRVHVARFESQNCRSAN